LVFSMCDHHHKEDFIMTFSHRLLAGVAAAGLLAASPVFAEQATDSGASYGTFESLDVNQDGYIDDTEWNAGTGMDSSGWTDYDLDADGRLSADEWGAFEENRMMDQGADVSNEASESPGSAETGGDSGEGGTD